ncbi:MAG TPA: hypothetical protein VEJ41_05665 [Candidatus Acidoferrales bacterium]|nr:hypothetical protein [Candidatus Acidoferrales bacterium]
MIKRFMPLCALLAAVLAACTTGQTGGPTLTMGCQPTSPSCSRLQVAVGTANIYGMSTGLNVVSTMRQPNGESALGVDTPILTGPFTQTNAAEPAAGTNLPDPYTTAFFFAGSPSLGAGPSLPETLQATPTIFGTSQLVHPGTPFCDSKTPPPAGFTQCPAGIPPNTSTFGQSGGVFAMGLAPYNIVANTAQSYSYQPYPQPMYDSGATHPLFVPWGGPPAFDPDGNGMGTRDGLIILGNDSFTGYCVPNGCPYFLGVGEGVTFFEGVTPGTGTYMLAVQVGVIGNNGTKTISTISSSAQLSSLTILPTLSAPLVTPDADGDGGASFNATVPAGVTEALVQIVDYGPGGGPLNGGGTAANCQGPKGTSFAPVYYTIVVKTSGAYALGDANGPNNLAKGPGSLTPTPSICTAAQNDAVVGVDAGDNFTVQMIGFDYPDYEAALSLTKSSVPQAPVITGTGGQSDITISLGAEEDYPGYSATPLTDVRRPLTRGVSTRRSAPAPAPDAYRKLGLPSQARVGGD